MSSKIEGIARNIRNVTSFFGSKECRFFINDTEVILQVPESCVSEGEFVEVYGEYEVLGKKFRGSVIKSPRVSIYRNQTQIPARTVNDPTRGYNISWIRSEAHV